MASQRKNNSLFDIVKSIPIIDIIAKIVGVTPARTSGNDYWYLSFLRSQETIPSVKVNSMKNVWSDYGLGIGGNGYDLLKFYLKTEDIGLIVKVLRSHFPGYFLSDQPIMTYPKNRESEKPKNEIVRIATISHPALIKYVKSREIGLDLANRFCQEIWYKNNDKEYFAVGFKNKTGYELRNRLFKGCTAKDITFIDNGSNECTVFEGYFSWLSLFELNPECETSLNHLILNSINNFSRSEDILRRQVTLKLFLDNDDGGFSVVEKIKNLDLKFIDESKMYEGFKDLNEFLIHIRKVNGNSKYGS